MGKQILKDFMSLLLKEGYTLFQGFSNFIFNPFFPLLSIFSLRSSFLGPSYNNKLSI